MEEQPASDEGKQASMSSKEGGGSASSNNDSSNNINNKKKDDQPQQPPFSSSALPLSRPDAWGVLTAISDKAKARPQGPHILLYNSEHILGRSVKDPSCQFDSLNVSAKHCTIFRKHFKANESCIPLQGTEPVSGDRWLVYVKDSSSNGTFINCQKLKRDSPEARIKDGDIISLVNVPEHENAFAFVYEELKAKVSINSIGTTIKRKPTFDGEHVGESMSGDSKRLKGLGSGGSEGPVSLDDVRRLQRSNEELRNQLEGHVLTIEKLRSESRAATARHDAEIIKLKEILSAAFSDQIEDLGHELAKKEKEIESYSSLCAQQQSKLEDVNQSLAAAIQSRKDADEIIKSQKLEIVELKEQLEDEHNQRKKEREKGEADLKAAVERARSEASEELRRQAECAARQEKDHLELINKLRDADEENRSLIEALRSKLEDTRENLVAAERTSRSLDLRLNDEVAALALARKKIAEKAEEIQMGLKELQKEKADKEEALARLSALELEMETAIRDLSFEKQRLQGARERIVLRETQLRAFHSTAEDIAVLQKKQQEQLQSMMKVLEDGDEETDMPAQNSHDRKVAVGSMDMHTRGSHHQVVEESGHSNHNSITSNKEKSEDMDDADSQNTASNSSPHDQGDKCVVVEGEGDTQMDDMNGSNNAKLVVMLDELKQSKPLVHTGIEAEYTQVLGDETQLLVSKNEAAQSKVVLFGYTQLLELDSNGKSGSGRHVNETQLLGIERDEIAQTMIVDDSDAQGVKTSLGGLGQVQQTLLLEEENDFDRHNDKGGGSTMPVIEEEDEGGARVQVEKGVRRPNAPLNTLDLMTSEVAGSWAFNTPASMQCNNGGWSQTEEREAGGTQRGSEEEAARAHLQGSEGIKGDGWVKELQHAGQNALSPRMSTRHDKEHRDLNVMLEIVAPDFGRLHGLDRAMEAAPDSEDHTEEEDDEGHESDTGSVESEPASQAVSVSARYQNVL